MTRDQRLQKAGERRAHRWDGYVDTTPLDRARSTFHREFDALWRPGKRRMFQNRAAAYAWLSSVLGIAEADCHVRDFDMATCRRALAAVRSVA